MKKLISIGVALAVLALVVLPVGAAAQCEYEGVMPDTYAKIPFAILESGLMLVGGILDSLQTTLGLPDWLPTLVIDAAPWFGGPLSWTVDMLGWGIELLAEIMGVLTPLLGLPADLDVEGLLYTISCKLFTPFACVVPGANNFTPCAGVP